MPFINEDIFAVFFRDLFVFFFFAIVSIPISYLDANVSIIII